MFSSEFSQIFKNTILRAWLFWTISQNLKENKFNEISLYWKKNYLVVSYRFNVLL